MRTPVEAKIRRELADREETTRAKDYRDYAIALVISADTAYSTDTLLAMGVGHTTLRELRASGVKPKMLGKRAMYLGRDILNYLAQQGVKDGSS